MFIYRTKNSEIEFVNPKNSPVQQEKTTNIQGHRKKGEKNSSCQMSPSMQAKVSELDKAKRNL